jgi:hypothetical protein
MTFVITEERVLRNGEIGNGIHPAISAIVPDRILNFDKAVGLLEKSHHACTTKVAPRMGGGGMDRLGGVGLERSSLAALGSPTQPFAGLPPVQTNPSSIERETMLPMMGLFYRQR